MNRKVTGAILLLLFADFWKGSVVPTGSAISALVNGGIVMGRAIAAGALLWSAARKSLAEAIADAIAERFARVDSAKVQ